MTDRDTITLPREVVQLALDALEWSWGGEPMGTKELASITALRTALAAPTQEFDHGIGADRFKVVRGAFWWHIKIGDSPTEHGKFRSSEAAQKMADDLLREFRNGAFVQSAALAAPKEEHPGYVIGSHWLETAYSRVCAGEAEADVLRDIGLVRITDGMVETADIHAIVDCQKALRRDAERYRWLRNRAWFQDEFEGRYGDSGETVQELDAAIDAAMGEKR